MKKTFSKKEEGNHVQAEAAPLSIPASYLAAPGKLHGPRSKLDKVVPNKGAEAIVPTLGANQKNSSDEAIWWSLRTKTVGDLKAPVTVPVAKCSLKRATVSPRGRLLMP